MLPPRPRKKLVTIDNQQNQQFLFVKKINQCLKQPTKNALKTLNVNSQRPTSSYQGQKSRTNSRSNHKRLSTSIRLLMKSQNDSEQKFQQKINMKKQNFANFPKITSRSWGVYQLKSKRFISGNNTNKRIQVASLTKIMNLVTLISLLDQYGLDPKQIKVAMSQWATSMVGTSAFLKKRDIVSLQDLMFGMMLPSGNDAACQIAMVGGTILKLGQFNRAKRIYDRFQIQGMIQCRSNIVRYLAEMNKISRLIGMTNSKWANPHGLSNIQNKTTIQDMSLLCKTAMQCEYIRKIVNTKVYVCQIQSYFGSQGTKSRSIEWQNTNKMLGKGWNGIKTGITPNAGPCLAASLNYEANNRKYQYLVIVANCASMQRRWEEVQQIVNWAIFHDVN